MRFKHDLFKSRDQWVRRFALVPIVIGEELIWLEYFWERGVWRGIEDDPYWETIRSLEAPL